MSICATAGEAESGPEVSPPPSGSQPFQRWPSHPLCQRALSLPRTNASTRLTPQETAPGSEVSTPPWLSHPLQAPLHHLCQSPLSVPRTKMSRRPEDQEATSGPEVSTPPRDSHPDQAVPF